MVDQPQIFGRKALGRRCRVDSEPGEREHASAAPLVDRCLDLRGPHQIGLVRRTRPVWGRLVIVRATDFVLGAVAAVVVSWIDSASLLKSLKWCHLTTEGSSRRTWCGDACCNKAVSRWCRAGQSYSQIWEGNRMSKRTKCHIPFGTWCDWDLVSWYVPKSSRRRVIKHIPPPRGTTTRTSHDYDYGTVEIKLTKELEGVGQSVVWIVKAMGWPGCPRLRVNTRYAS